eukprot:SAG31_NODE_2469_length_5650_cov_2.117636_8_plen_221_part_00
MPSGRPNTLAWLIQRKLHQILEPQSLQVTFASVAVLMHYCRRYFKPVFCCTVCEASGSISAHKFNKTSIKSHVDIQMILFRLQKFKTELLITFNLPCTEVPSLEPVSKGTKEPEPEMPIYSTENGIAASGAVGQIRTVNDILTSFYREHAPESERKTAEQITTILQKRDDGGPFWFSKLRAALQAKYKVELQPLGLGTEARSIANVFVRQMRLKDPGLFG